jgi:drug/metabolite transporter (DMT)-like permease
VDVRRLLLSGLLLAGHWVSFFISVKIAGVAIATLGFASFPAFTVILEGLIFRERIRANEIVLVALVSIGLVLVTPEFDLASGATTGLLWSVLSGLLFSLLSLTNRASSARIPPVQAALCQNVVVALCLLPAAAPHLSEVRAHRLVVDRLARCVLHRRRPQPVCRQPGGDQGTNGCGGLCPGAGLRHHMAWLLFDENPTLRMLLGGALIIVAIVVSSRLSGSSSKKAVTAEAASH